MSQPWQGRSWPERGPGRGRAGSPGEPRSNWSRSRIVLTGESRPAASASPRTAAPDSGQRGPAPDGGQRGGAAADQPSAARLTGRGALLGMLVLWFLGILVSSWLHWSPLAGASFALGCVAAAWWTNPRDLLSVVVSPPILFFCALVGVKALTSTGNMLVSVAEGTVLTLAGVAPWLFAGVALSLIIAMFRGLPRCIRDLRRDLRGNLQVNRVRTTGNTTRDEPPGPRP